MIHQEDIEFLEHYGTKGMQWGVRKAQARAAKGPNRFGNRNNKRAQRNIDTVRRVASGKASTGDMVKAGLFAIPIQTILKAGGSLKGASAYQLDRAQRVQAKVVSGKKVVGDMFYRLYGMDIRELNYSYSD